MAAGCLTAIVDTVPGGVEIALLGGRVRASGHFGSRFNL